MKEEGKTVSVSKLMKWFSIPRSTFYYKNKSKCPRALDRALVESIRSIIDEHPTYGVRRITAMLRHRLIEQVNRKRVHRIIKANGWQVRKKPQGLRPRAFGMRSRASESDQRWAIDTTSIFCGRDGWCHLTAIIDCNDREIVGWRLSRSGIAKIAAAALEDALRERCIRQAQLIIRSDNGLVFGSKAFCKVAIEYGVSQEFITPYTPEQNGMIERFFKSLKEECVWSKQFLDQDHAFEEISRWITWYNTERPHSALGYVSPNQFRRQLQAA